MLDNLKYTIYIYYVITINQFIKYMGAVNYVTESDFEFQIELEQDDITRYCNDNNLNEDQLTNDDYNLLEEHLYSHTNESVVDNLKSNYKDWEEVSESTNDLNYDNNRPSKVLLEYDTLLNNNSVKGGYYRQVEATVQLVVRNGYNYGFNYDINIEITLLNEEYSLYEEVVLIHTFDDIVCFENHFKKECLKNMKPLIRSLKKVLVTKYIEAISVLAFSNNHNNLIHNNLIPFTQSNSIEDLVFKVKSTIKDILNKLRSVSTVCYY